MADESDKPVEPQAGTAAPTPATEQTIPPEVLKSAYNAFKKRWKITKLDQESRIGRSPLSGGKSTIAGIMPPDQFPREVWTELVRQKRLKNTGGGFLSMP